MTNQASETERLKILKKCYGHYKQEKNEFLFECPYCHKKKLSVNIRKNVYKCWSCLKRGKIPRLLGDTGKFNYVKDFSTDIFTIEDFLERYQEKPKLTLPSEFEIIERDRHPEAYEYIRQRGLTDSDIINYKLGFCRTGKYNNRVMIPSFNRDGELNFFVGRTIDKSQEMRYLTPCSSKNIVFNEILIDLERDIVLTEGYFDSMLFPNAIPIFGTSLSDYREITNFLVNSKKRVIVALDYGKEYHTKSICRALSKYSIDAWYITMDSDLDYGDLRQQLGRKVRPDRFNPQKYEDDFFFVKRKK